MEQKIDSEYVKKIQKFLKENGYDQTGKITESGAIDNYTKIGISSFCMKEGVGRGNMISKGEGSSKKYLFTYGTKSGGTKVVFKDQDGMNNVYCLVDEPLYVEFVKDVDNYYCEVIWKAETKQYGKAYELGGSVINHTGKIERGKRYKIAHVDLIDMTPFSEISDAFLAKVKARIGGPEESVTNMTQTGNGGGEVINKDSLENGNVVDESKIKGDGSSVPLKTDTKSFNAIKAEKLGNKDNLDMQKKMNAPAASVKTIDEDDTEGIKSVGAFDKTAENTGPRLTITNLGSLPNIRILFPNRPDDISDTISVKWDTAQPRGRSASYFGYSSTTDRSCSFSVTVYNADLNHKLYGWYPTVDGRGEGSLNAKKRDAATRDRIKVLEDRITVSKRGVKKDDETGLYTGDSLNARTVYLNTTIDDAAQLLRELEKKGNSRTPEENEDLEKLKKYFGISVFSEEELDLRVKNLKEKVKAQNIEFDKEIRTMEAEVARLKSSLGKNVGKSNTALMNFVNICKSLAYPEYTDNGQLRPPICYVNMYNSTKFLAICESVGVTWGGDIQAGVPNKANISFNFTAVTDLPFSSSTIIRDGNNTDYNRKLDYNL